MENSKNVLSGGQLAGGNSTSKREENDFYATDPQTTKLFLNEFRKDNHFEGEILEPACGQGHMVKAIKEIYPKAKIIATDLIDRGFGEGNINFLTHNYNKTFDTVITNPPFSLAKEFVERGLEVSDRLVIMLCKVQLLEGAKRKDMFISTPLKCVYVHTTRQATWKEGKPLNPKGGKWATTMCLAWFVWDKQYDGEPTIKWI